jgi:hypothetical protein
MPLLSDLAVEHLKTHEYTSIHMLKTFLISKSVPVVRDVASGGIINLEVAGIEGVGNGNTDKTGFARVILRGL